jgi:hypothetical protein
MKAPPVRGDVPRLGGKHALPESAAVTEGVHSLPKEPGHDNYGSTYEQDRNEQPIGAQSCCLGDESSRADQDEESDEKRNASICGNFPG